MRRHVLAVLLLPIWVAGCLDSGSESARLERRMDELVKELRQTRAEVQRGNERLIAAMQDHFSTAGGYGSPAAAAPRSLGVPVDAARSMEASRALQQAHVTMSERMSAVPVTGDPDRDFLAQMIPHHEGAIDMSKVLLQGGLRPEVRRLAQEIIAHQQSEIEIMRRWLEAVSK